MKKKAILAIILALALCLCACGASTKLNKGDLVYQVLEKDEKVADILNEYPTMIKIGYEATDGYLGATIEDADQIKLLSEAFTKVKVGSVTAEDDLEYYPMRNIDFYFGDDEVHSYYFSENNCFTYDSKKDVLTYYGLEEHEDLFGLIDLLIVINNQEYFDDSYNVYDDSDASASIIDYQLDDGLFYVDFVLNNESGEDRIFTVKDFAIDGNPIDTDTFFVVGAGENFSYKAPIKIGDADTDSVSGITFKLLVTNAMENPSYIFETEEISIVPNI